MANKTEETLSAEDKRLLLWLARYPFQRAQDLIVGLAPWEKRSAIYERLSSLTERHLIEAFLPGITRGTRLYHLSPSGMYLCDQLPAPINLKGQERHTCWESRGQAEILREERTRLARLLPRLPVALRTQDLVNGLVTHATDALTSQGRHAQMVQWDWIRDYHHTFLTARDEPLRVHAEGALALCMRFTPGARVAMPQPHIHASEGWYTLLLLHCPLDDPRLMRARLERVLRWRESAERQAIYSQMPPLLVIATSERQAEWWQQAVARVATRLQVDRPSGAVTVLPAETAPFNSWRLPWKRLGTNEPCHLQELLHPFSAPTLPELGHAYLCAREPLAPQHTPKDETQKLLLPTRLQKSVFALSGKPQSDSQKRASTRRFHEPKPSADNDARLASVTLTPRHWELIQLCFAHPFLSCEDLTRLLMLSRTSINLLLANLARAGYLSSVDTVVGERWQVADAGLRLLARLASCHVHHFLHFPLEENQPPEQRGARGLLHQIRHTAGVYAFFAQLSRELAAQPNSSLRWWETGVLTECHFRYHDKTYRFRPDALASVQLGERTFRFWLEWDRGTMTPRNLRAKFSTYAMYLASREWAHNSPYLPTLLCICPDIVQEQRLIKAATQCLAHAPSGLCVYTANAHYILADGISTSKWRQIELEKGHQYPTQIWEWHTIF